MISDFLPRLEGRSFFLKISVLVLLIAVFLLLTMVIGIVIAIPFFGLDAVMHLTIMDNMDEKQTILLKFFQLINQLGVFVLPALAFAYLYNRKPVEYLHLDKRIPWRHLLLSIILIFVSMPAINRMVVWNEQMDLPDFFNGLETWMKNSETQTKQLTDAFLNVTSFIGLLGNLLIIAFLAAIGEELLFRGVILKLLMKSMKNIHLAVLISAILFSGLHMQFYGFLPRAILGILFGYVFIWSGSLWLPMVLHFIFNGISVVAAYLYNIGSITTDLDSLGNTPNNYVVLISVVVSLLILFYLQRIRVTSSAMQQEEIPESTSPDLD